MEANDHPLGWITYPEMPVRTTYPHLPEENCPGGNRRLADYFSGECGGFSFYTAMLFLPFRIPDGARLAPKRLETLSR
jgi:hypothetical protein